MFAIITQDPAYHQFAGPRWMLVVSNLPFLIVGLAGLRRATQSWIARVFFLAVAATAFGSAWYHLHPDNPSLFWDRLPMAVGFMALFALTIGERFGLPLIAAGAASVVWWRISGDLLPYALVQFVLLPVIPALRRSLVTAILCYAAAKIFELLDTRIWALGHIVSGHTLKHLAAAMATCFVISAFGGEVQAVQAS
jgi:hypothetical protein